MDYSTLLERYGAISLEKQYTLSDIIGESNWNVDMKRGTILFDNEVEFPIQILGTFSFTSETWLWAWANEASNIPESLLKDAESLKQTGIEKSIEPLYTPEFKAEISDIHAIGMIASGILGSSAYYNGNFGDGIILVTIKGEQIDNLEFDEQARITSVFPNLISAFTINHKKAFINYLEIKGYAIAKGSNDLVAQKGDRILSASFDEQNRLTKLNGEIK